MEKIEYIELLEGMRGFLRFSMDHEKMSKEQIIGTLLHDINGTLQEEACFSPRTNPYRNVPSRHQRSEEQEVDRI